MKILGMDIEWNNQWINNPSIKVIVDNYERPDYVYGKRGNLYCAVDKSGFVNYLAWSGKGNDGGFCGEEWFIKLKNKKRIKVKGAWSSRSECMNKAGFHLNTEVTIQDGNPYSLIAGAMLNNRLVELLKEYLPNVKYYIHPKEKRIIISKEQDANDRRIK